MEGMFQLELNKIKDCIKHNHLEEAFERIDYFFQGEMFHDFLYNDNKDPFSGNSNRMMDEDKFQPEGYSHPRDLSMENSSKKRKARDLEDKFHHLSNRYRHLIGAQYERNYRQEDVELQRNQIISTFLAYIREIEKLVGIEQKGENSKEKKKSNSNSPVNKELLSKFVPLAIVLFVAILALVSYQTLSTQKKEVLIIGKVFDFDNNNLPIKNASVEIISGIGEFTHTDSRGSFILKAKGNSTEILEFQVTHPEYSSQNFTVLIPFDDGEQHKIEKFLLRKE